MLGCFKWFRKLRGGKWILLEITYPETNDTSEFIISYWCKINNDFELQINEKILKKENYDICIR